jgi:beta-hydroxyacyl-ACP dehydratase FabZ
MNIREIIAFLPHKYPLLLLDKVLELNKNYIVAQKNVTIDEPFFQGHFPDNPIMPGVFQIEIMAQASGILGMEVFEDKKEREYLLMNIENAKFRRPVTPGDVLKIKVELLNKKGNIFKFKGVTTADNIQVASAKFLATMREKV